MSEFKSNKLMLNRQVSVPPPSGGQATVDDQASIPGLAVQPNSAAPHTTAPKHADLISWVHEASGESSWSSPLKSKADDCQARSKDAYFSLAEPDQDAENVGPEPARSRGPDVIRQADMWDHSTTSRAVRTLSLETASNVSVDQIIRSCKTFGSLHSVSHVSAGHPASVTVTFVDSRDCNRATEAFSRCPDFATVVRAGTGDLQNEPSGTVLALKRRGHSFPDEDVSVEQIRSMLSLFGPIASDCKLALPENATFLIAHVFEFYSVLHAQQAVSAVRDIPGCSFSLHVVRPNSGAASQDECRNFRLASTEGSQDSYPDRIDGPTSMLDSPMHVVPTPPPVEFHPYQSRTSAPSYCSSYDGRNIDSTSMSHSMSMHCLSSPPTGPPAPAAPSSQTYATSRDSPPLPAPPFHHTAVWPFPHHMHSDGAAPAPPPVPAAAPAPPGRRADFLTEFDVHEASTGGSRARTTVMIRNIPCRWSAEDLLSVLDVVIENTWDLLYMPCKSAEIANSGYAFMNFATSQDALHLYSSMHGRHWPNTRSGKICEVRYARIQGRQLLSHLTSSEKSDTSAFRGFLAYPSHGQIVIHGPDAMRPPFPAPARPLQRAAFTPHVAPAPAYLPPVWQGGGRSASVPFPEHSSGGLGDGAVRHVASTTDLYGGMGMPYSMREAGCLRSGCAPCAPPAVYSRDPGMHASFSTPPSCHQPLPQDDATGAFQLHAMLQALVRSVPPS